MTNTPYAAFGYVLFLSSAEAGEQKLIKLGNTSNYVTGIYFYVDGLAKSYVVETGEVLKDRVAGWLNTEVADAPTGGSTVRSEFSVHTEWVCIPNANNPWGLPKVSSLILDPQSQQALTNGTNLFLAKGSLAINGRQFNAPAQIRIRSGDVIAESLTKTYSLLFI